MTKEEDYMDIAVAGLHLSGQPLNHQLVQLGSIFKKSCFTGPFYKMFLIEDERGRKPGLVRVNENGRNFALEIWSMPKKNVGSFVALIPPPLGIGSLLLEDQSWVKGFIAEPIIISSAKDISHYSGWLDYLKDTNT